MIASHRPACPCPACRARGLVASIGIRLSPAHRAACEVAASRAGLTLADWCRARLADVSDLPADEPHAPGTAGRGIPLLLLAVTPELRAQVETAAVSAGLSLSSYARRVFLHAARLAVPTLPWGPDVFPAPASVDPALMVALQAAAVQLDAARMAERPDLAARASRLLGRLQARLESAVQAGVTLRPGRGGRGRVTAAHEVTGRQGVDHGAGGHLRHVGMVEDVVYASSEMRTAAVARAARRMRIEQVDAERPAPPAPEAGWLTADEIEF